MTHILDYMNDYVLLADGAMGTQVQARDLSIEKDYCGCENCTDVLSISRPDVIRDIHIRYLQAGANAVETNSFGGATRTLGEFDLSHLCFDLNKQSAEIAREAIDACTQDDKPRFVLGSIGPGTKLPSLGHISYDALEQSIQQQCEGLLSGGVDALLVETVQDPLQAKAALTAALNAIDKTQKDVPLFCQVTIETTGTLLVGTDIQAASTIIHPFHQVALLGLNCATGPQEMAPHIQSLSEHWPRMMSALPNAGLPELVDGKTHYPLGPEEMTRWLERFVFEWGVTMVGGCCGTTPEHIQAIDAMLSKHADNAIGRPRVKKRQLPASSQASAASLYKSVPFAQENAFFSIGERCNANGSKAFRVLQEQEDWERCVAMGDAQIKEGAHALDVCTAFVGRKELDDMDAMVTRMRGAMTVPLVIDSTEYDVLEHALSLYGGKAIINSMNFEDGVEPARKRLALAKRFGSAIIALTIDEKGMAKTCEEKCNIAQRLYDVACQEHGLDPHDLLIDPLTFTICTGNEEDRRHGIETLNAIKAIREKLPLCQIILGLSNISFGLNPAARHVLNAVFLDHALKHGMNAAIIHVGRIVPLHTIPNEDVTLCEDLIYDRRREGYDPLTELLKRFADRQEDKTHNTRAKTPKTIEEKLKQRIIDGDRVGLDEDLAIAMKTHTPLAIINTILLEGMKVVGELFGAGKMQLPFVLQSAETMKKSVAFLEPHMERTKGQHKGLIVLATVRGDVHDIGKNLVDIILTNNGYKVMNLGIKQPIESIIEAAHTHKANAIGMSGLLVKSTVIMRENLEEMTKQDMTIPVILGGAALNRRYVVEECVPAYACGQVAYAQDAFDGLQLMEHVRQKSFDQALEEQKQRIERHQKKRKEKKPEPATQNTKPQKTQPQNITTRPTDDMPAIAISTRHIEETDIPTPPFWGPRLVSHVPLKTLIPYVNRRMLFQFHWGYKKEGRSPKEFQRYAAETLEPILHTWIQRADKERIFQPQALYGYWPCGKEGNDLVLFDPETPHQECARFTLPRQNHSQQLCITDFLRSANDKQRDCIALQLVTVGRKATTKAQELFEENAYQDYLYLHGLGVELAESMAEYIHKRIRHEWGYGHEDAESIPQLLQHQYRGTRYSFGYPACPNLADQRMLLRLLDGQRIDVHLSEGDQLDPEQSTSAIVLHHPQSGYFSI
ncbi:MAG: methionine synthase [Alphaproteobacteria bacterium GM7ARS4]|nr:methionine synthase [Alphaproteobacteria bacterium GM7ARS4]